jgi:hypothetical protein
MWLAGCGQSQNWCGIGRLALMLAEAEVAPPGPMEKQLQA